MKVCNVCGETKPLDSFRKRSDRSGVRYLCIKCESIESKKRREAKKTVETICACGCESKVFVKPGESTENRFVHGHLWKLHDPKNHPNYKPNSVKREYRNGVEGKICKHCANWKPIGDFYFVNSHGYKIAESDCKKCVNLKTSAWAKNNPEKNKAKAKRARDKNPEKNYQNVKEWRKTNQHKRAEEARRYRKKRPDVSRAAVKKWVKNNYENVLSYNHSRRLKGKELGRYTPQEWQWLLTACESKCLKCNRTVSELKESGVPISRDHIVPVSIGGLNVIENIQPLCKNCNSQKRVEVIDYRPQWLTDNFTALKTETGL